MEFGTAKIRYRLRFQHLKQGTNGIVTTCTIQALTDSNEWIDTTYKGQAKCHPNDHFVRETGRKMALKRALKEFTRDTRRKAWAAYWERLVPRS